MDELKTLEELWNDAGRKPVKVIDESIVEKNRQPCWLVGMRGKHCYVTFEDTPLTCMSNERRWKVYLEKTLVEHWPAIVKNLLGEFFVTERLFREEYEPRKEFKDRFIRLATELPPIMLETEE